MTTAQFTDFGLDMRRHRVKAKVIGAGRKKPRRGKGSFEDVWSGVKSIGAKVGDIALNKGGDLLFKKLLGGKRRKKRKVRR